MPFFPFITVAITIIIVVTNIRNAITVSIPQATYFLIGTGLVFFDGFDWGWQGDGRHKTNREKNENQVFYSHKQLLCGIKIAKTCLSLCKGDAKAAWDNIL